MPAVRRQPVHEFPVDQLRDRAEEDRAYLIFSHAQERAFFEACLDWQRGIFETLASYGLRVGELTHLLIEEVDLAGGVIEIRSKPHLFWSVKTGRCRQLPIVPRVRPLLERAIGGRAAGFVFLNRDHASGATALAASFASPQAFRTRLESIAAEVARARPDAGEREKRRAVTAFCRTMGQIPEKRVRCEFMTLTRAIGCPEYTKVHDLRHLFSSRAQEAGMNPLMVQELLGHATLDMTRRYTHLGLDSKRQAMERFSDDANDAGPAA